MKKSFERLGILPYLILGFGLLILGLMAMNHIIDNWWPMDVERLDLVRATALDQVDPASIMEAANTEIILAFLSAVLVATTGIALPITFYLNRRFSRQQRVETPHFLVVLRQAMFIGFWASFCLWLQMNRMLGIAVVVLVAGVLILFEILLQIRTRTAKVTA
jgi:ABC-type xylose transport system permease subunit